MSGNAGAAGGGVPWPGDPRAARVLQAVGGGILGVLLAIIQGLFWPAFMVYEVFQALVD